MSVQKKMVPVMLYPYLYLLCPAIYVRLWDMTDGAAVVQDTGIPVLLGLGAICNLYAFYAVITAAAGAAGGRFSAQESARLAMMVKLVHIPAYLFHFALGVLGLLLSVWGLGLILWALLIDVLTIVLTGILSAGASVRCRRENILTGTQTALYAVCGFVYCADVLCAVRLYRKTRARGCAAAER